MGENIDLLLLWRCYLGFQFILPLHLPLYFSTFCHLYCVRLRMGDTLPAHITVAVSWMF